MIMLCGKEKEKVGRGGSCRTHTILNFIREEGYVPVFNMQPAQLYAVAVDPARPTARSAALACNKQSKKATGKSKRKKSLLAQPCKQYDLSQTCEMA